MTADVVESVAMNEVEAEFQPKDKYTVEFPSDTEFLLLSASAEYPNAACRIKHPNILQTERRILAFKAYWPDGRKKWFERPGVSFLFAIHKSKINLLKKAGYSYVPVEIGGVEYRLNVSGGTNGENWTDYVRHGSSIGVFRAKKRLKALLDNAYIPDNLEIPEPRKMDERETQLYHNQCAYYDTKKKLEYGDVVRLNASYWGDDCRELTIVERPRRKQYFVCCVRGEEDLHWSFQRRFKVKYKMVDWTITASMNGIEWAQEYTKEKNNG